MYNIALVGCGRIAVRHSELLGKGLVENAKLSCVCDIDIERAKKIGEKFNVPYYDNMDDMMESEDVDLVSVLTPSGLHAEHVINLSKYKKHIIVEKPMALTLSDADDMIEACKIHGIKLFVVKQNRFNLPVLKLREAVEEKRFGKLVLGTIRVRWTRTQEYYDQDPWRGTWAYDGGVLTNQASHHIDLLQWMMGGVKSVFAKSATALVNIEVEDTAIVILKFNNGALGVIEATTAVRPKDLEGSISILGERGTVEISGFAVNEMKTWDFVDNCEKDKNVIEHYSVNPPDVYGFGHKEYLNHVIECLKSGEQALIDGIEGRKSIELINAIYESIESGKEIFLENITRKSRLGQR